MADAERAAVIIRKGFINSTGLDDNFQQTGVLFSSNADSVVCPACSTSFEPTSTTCPNCGLQFG